MGRALALLLLALPRALAQTVSCDAADLLYHAEFSSDLGVTDPWAPDGASEAVTPIDDDWEMVTVEDSLDASPKRFGRLRFEYHP